MTRPIHVAYGTGAFSEGARLVVDFDFDGGQRRDANYGAQTERRLELIPVHESPRSIPRSGQFLDQALWSILDTDRRQAKAVWGPKVH